LALCAFLCVVSSQRITNRRRVPHVKRLLRRPSRGQEAQGFNTLSHLDSNQDLRSNRRTLTLRTGHSKPSSIEARSEPISFEPSPLDDEQKFEGSSERFVPYQPRPEFRSQNVPEGRSKPIRSKPVQLRDESFEVAPTAVNKMKPTRPAAYLDGSILYRKPDAHPRPSKDIIEVPEKQEYLEILKEAPLKPQEVPQRESQPRSERLPPPREAEPLRVVDFKKTEEVERQFNTPNIFDFSKEIQPFSQEVQQFETKRKPQQQFKQIRPFEESSKPSRQVVEETLVKAALKRKKVAPQNFRTTVKDLKKEKRETLQSRGDHIDPYGAQFVEEVQKVEDIGNKEGRISFQLHGLKGPHSYRFGYDTGKGYNRQFRFEERDNYGEVKGRYGYFDKNGKLQVVNYSAHPKHGFSADVPKY
ncbi:hypothetical protein Avbf_17222, partial [Armadillidium vulgare]